ncbi:uncharacterized protein [Pyxicephalus adspersus]|uniref:uncharacterized protein isoform X2 n=1 Tax=Pyxicephalus adspersus TaxID=30357 RepID=UPI003B5C5FA9
MDSREGPIRLHFHDTVQINIHPSSQPQWDDPPPVPISNNAADDGRWNGPPNPRRRNETEEFYQIFLRAKPKLRGLVTSGSMTLRARVIPSYKLVKACFILHTISCIVSFAGLALCCFDEFNIIACNSCSFGNIGTLSIITFLLMTNVVQLLSSGCILIFSYHSLKSIPRNPPQTTATPNLGVISLDPPAYSEVSTTLPQPSVLSQSSMFLHPSTFLHPPESAEPPVYSNLPEYFQPPEFVQTEDPPPPYS